MHWCTQILEIPKHITRISSVYTDLLQLNPAKHITRILSYWKFQNSKVPF